jgi:hypothetical protein
MMPGTLSWANCALIQGKKNTAPPPSPMPPPGQKKAFGKSKRFFLGFPMVQAQGIFPDS